MRAEKKLITKEYVARLNVSPFFIVVGYQGLKVPHFTEFRSRLRKAGAEVHVVKNSIFAIAAKECGVADLNTSMTGQIAVVTGQKEISGAAKIVKNFGAEFDKLKVKFAFMGNTRMSEAELMVLADLPSIEVLRSKLLGVLNAPAQKLVTMINTPGTLLAQVIKAKSEKAEKAE